jgi:hypothetical protein
MKFHILSELFERQNIHYYCIAAGSHCYDLVVIYSGNFLRKAMVISIQSKRMVLLSREDIQNADDWVPRLGFVPEDKLELEQFLNFILDQQQFIDQY